MRPAKPAVEVKYEEINIMGMNGDTIVQYGGVLTTLLLAGIMCMAMIRRYIMRHRSASSDVAVVETAGAAVVVVEKPRGLIGCIKNYVFAFFHCIMHWMKMGIHLMCQPFVTLWKFIKCKLNIGNAGDFEYSKNSMATLISNMGKSDFVDQYRKVWPRLADSMAPLCAKIRKEYGDERAKDFVTLYNSMIEISKDIYKMDAASAAVTATAK